MEDRKPEIIPKIKMALGGVGKPNDDLDAEIVYNDMKSYADSEIHVSCDFNKIGETIIPLDLNNKDTLISFDELKSFKISCNHTLNFKVKKQKSDFQKRIQNLQNSIK